MRPFISLSAGCFRGTGAPGNGEPISDPYSSRRFASVEFTLCILIMDSQQPVARAVIVGDESLPQTVSAGLVTAHDGVPDLVLRGRYDTEARRH
jgi:hypothetical protein